MKYPQLEPILEKQVQARDNADGTAIAAVSMRKKILSRWDWKAGFLHTSPRTAEDSLQGTG